jgi:DNA (cytosine-5)-methyltransferase 1
MRGAELFAGCGGLALGMSRAGFEHSLMAEFDADAVATVEFNKKRDLDHVRHWPIALQDVREIQWTRHRGKLAVISGGPPCQPFGIGGKKKGHHDERDMWPEAIRAVREAQPDGFMFENVRNLAGPKFCEYLEWIVRHLGHPSEECRSGETHAAHLARLLSSKRPPDYRIIWQVVNAADYGAPQVRFRVLIFGIKASLEAVPEILPPTHSRDRLFWDQYITGEYWKRNGLKRRANPQDDRTVARVTHIRKLKVPPLGLPWVTARDALAGLGEPSGKQNHVFQPGARIYPGHTGSPLDLPAKALKAGDHGVPGGENMMVLDNGSVRYFTIREAARLVGLPDEYFFPCSWTESMRQLGNAVPAQLAEAAGRWLGGMLKMARDTSTPKKRARAA